MFFAASPKMMNTNPADFYLDNIIIEEVTEVECSDAEIQAFNMQNGKYRYGFNGKEIDPESGKYDYGFRMYSAELARFLSVDPLTQSYPWYTPYQFAGNKPIMAIDLDGLEEFIIHDKWIKTYKGESFLYKVHFDYLNPNQRGIKNNGTYYLAKPDEPEGIEYSTKYFTNNNVKTGIVDNDLNNPYSRAKKNYISNGGKSGDDYLEIGFDAQFATDKGTTLKEVEVEVTKSKSFDQMVAILVYDPNSQVEITGYASPKATNIKKSEKTTESKNNDKLALKEPKLLSILL